MPPVASRAQLKEHRQACVLYEHVKAIRAAKECVALCAIGEGGSMHSRWLYMFVQSAGAVRMPGILLRQMRSATCSFVLTKMFWKAKCIACIYASATFSPLLAEGFGATGSLLHVE